MARLLGLSHGGLSPRVRGNPGQVRPGQVRSGSIPARAGEPAPADYVHWQQAVYPRACGGTPETPTELERKHGLSPRVRGNPMGIYRLHPDPGSIPARAGEPGPLHSQC